jgi:hypothetical protein
MRSIEYLWSEVELEVCRVCIDSVGGVCSGIQSDRCALKKRFAGVVDAIASVTSVAYGPYVEALREKVCAECEHRFAEGRCSVRDNVECALDRYYPLVIDAVEEALYGPQIEAAVTVH